MFCRLAFDDLFFNLIFSIAFGKADGDDKE